MLFQEQFRQAGQSRQVIGLLRQDSLPLGLSQVKPVILNVRCCQVVPGYITPNSCIHAGKMCPRRCLQRLLPSMNGPDQISRMPKNDTLLEQQFYVIGEQSPPFPAGSRGFALPAQLILTLDNEGVELADNRIARLGSFETSAKQGQCLLQLAQF